jgi:hypothetical protein
MQEPSPLTFSLVAVFVTWLGPVLGPYALILFAAAAGSVLLYSNKPSNACAPRWGGVKFVALGTVIAMLLTSPFVWLLHKYTSVPPEIALIPVAFVLGVGRDHLVTFTNQVLEAMAAAFGAFLSAVAGARGGKR